MYYNYIIIDPRVVQPWKIDDYEIASKYQPIYVGKGKLGTNRHLQHINEANKWTDEQLEDSIEFVNDFGYSFNGENIWKIQKLKSIIEDGFDISEFIIKFNYDDDEEWVLEQESLIINMFGKQCNGTGCLTNILD